MISVASNLAPAEVKSMVDAALSGDFQKAEALHRKYYRLFTDIFVESNPVPIKVLLKEKGWMSEDCRLPLSKITDTNRAKVVETAKRVGVL